MRTHGWSGSAPATDDEAMARVLTAAGRAIDERGADFSIADVARTLGDAGSFTGTGGVAGLVTLCADR